MYGDRLYISDEQDGVSITESETAIVMTIRQPRPGLWQVFETEGGQVVPSTPPSDRSRAFLVTTASGISIDADLVDRKHYEGQTARVRIEVNRNGRPVCDSGQPGQPQCTVGIVPEVSWVDRGGDPQEHVLDPASVSVVQVDVGVYELRFPVAISGTYSVKFDVSFNRSNLEIERTKRLSFFVPQLSPALDIEDSIVGPTTLVVDTSVLVAGSQQGALVVLDLRNYQGEGLAGREVYFTSNLGSFEGQVLDYGNGIYSQAFIAGTKAGVAQITAVAKERIESPGVPEPDGGGVVAMDVGAPETQFMSAKLGRIAQVEIKAASVDPASCDLQLASGLEFLYRNGTDRVRLTLKDPFGNIVADPADVAFFLVDSGGSVLEGDVESVAEGVYEQNIVGAPGYVTTSVGASVNGASVGEVLLLPVFDSPPWSSDCDGDGWPDQESGLRCRNGSQWWSPVGSYECDFDAGALTCDAPGASFIETAYYWRPGFRAFDVGKNGHVYGLKGSALEALQPVSGCLGSKIGLAGRVDLGSVGYDVEVVGTHAYVAAHKGIIVVDISSPSTPVVVARIQRAVPAVSIETDGMDLYVADGYGITVYDLQDMANPVEAAHLDLVQCRSETLCRLQALLPMPHPLSVDRGYAAFADGNKVYAIDVRKPSLPQHLGTYVSSSWIMDLKLWRRYIYLADGSRQVVDARIPEEPVPAGSHDVLDWVMGMKQSGDWAYKLSFSFLEGVKIQLAP